MILVSLFMVFIYYSAYEKCSMMIHSQGNIILASNQEKYYILQQKTRDAGEINDAPISVYGRCDIDHTLFYLLIFELSSIEFALPFFVSLLILQYIEACLYEFIKQRQFEQILLEHIHIGV